MTSLKNNKITEIKKYQSSKRNTVIFLALIVLTFIIAFKLGGNTKDAKVEPVEQVKPAEPTPTPYPLMQCDPLTSQITDGKTTKECIQQPTTTPTPPVKKQSVVTDQEIIAYIKTKAWDASTAIAIAKSENFFNLTRSFDCARVGAMNSNFSRDYGIFQINDIHFGSISKEDALDCYKNIDFAYGLYEARGNFTAWSAFLNGRYLAHL